MALSKRTYVSGQTIITAENLNDIQDSIIALEKNDGIIPHIGDNGNWYIGENDTGKPSRGTAGAPGKTPVRGADYWTAADRQEIVNSVIAALPDGTEVSY